MEVMDYGLKPVMQNAINLMVVLMYDLKITSKVRKVFQII